MRNAAFPFGPSVSDMTWLSGFMGSPLAVNRSKLKPCRINFDFYVIAAVEGLGQPASQAL